MEPEHTLLEPTQEPGTSEQHEEPAQQPTDDDEHHAHDSEMLAASPPSVLIEPEVPNPFIVDDDGDDSNSDDEPAQRGGLTAHTDADDDEGETPAAEDEIALAQSMILERPPLSAADVDKPMPAPPADAPPEEEEAPKEVAGETAGLAYDEDDDDEDEDEDDEDDEPPELYLPGLILPTMFLPIPNTDPLSSLLLKYVPPERRPSRDVSGEWQHTDFHTLVMTNSWRALARMARDRIVKCNPGDVGLILELWSLRLSSLARLRLFNQTSAELNNLYSVLTSNSIPADAPLSSSGRPQGLSPREYLWQKLVPFELEVLHAKTRYWVGDHMGYVDELVGLIARCKRKARAAARGPPRPASGKPAKVVQRLSERAKAREERRREREKVKEKEREREKEMWKERGARVCLILASQLVEMKEFIAAARLLEPLAHQAASPSSSPENGEKITSPYILAAIGRIYLQAGDLAKAASYFAQVNAHYALVAQLRSAGGDGSEKPLGDEGLGSLLRMNEALLACAEGRWEDAERTFVELIRTDSDAYAATNNLAVALLSQGRLKEGIYVLESALKQSPATLCATEPFLFNLSTLYELRSNIAADKKRDLLAEVSKWAGDGLRTACLKMPT